MYRPRYFEKPLCDEKCLQFSPSILNYVYLLSFLFLDNDGDAVSFSTDDELTEALGHVSNGIFKINVASQGKHTLFELYDKCLINVYTCSCLFRFWFYVRRFARARARFR